MPRPLSDLLPDEFFYQNRKQDVIRFLQLQPAPGNTRRDWLFLWALWVGMRINRSDYAKVQHGSVDA